jgi:hypothetical protein
MAHLGSKLVLLAALLSAVALAAPRTVFVDDDNTIAEEALVQTAAKTSSAVSMLKQEFRALQVQLKSSSKITPGVAKVIDDMVKMVENEIEPAIKKAHSSDKDLIKSEHSALVTFREAQIGVRDQLLQTGEDIEKDSLAHNTVAAEWDQAAKDFVAAIGHYHSTCKSKTDTCCDKQQAAVPGIEYTPAFAKCDYTAKDADGCTGRAEADAVAAVQSGFEAGLARYNALNAGCDTEAGKLAAATTDVEAKNAHCDDKASDARERKKDLDARIEQFDKNWGEATGKYATEHKKLTDSYANAKTTVKKQEADRKDEWKSTQEIKCLLNNYKAGGSFDTAAMNTCKDSIKTEHLNMEYPADPEKVVWNKPTFTPLTDTTPYGEECDKTWNTDCEKADAPGACSIKKTPPVPKCVPGTPEPGSDGTGGPRWSLSAAAQKFAQ